MIVYHGTSKENAENIRKNGLRMSKCTPGYFGKGFYTTPDFGLALHNYAFSNGEVLIFEVSQNAKIIDMRTDDGLIKWNDFMVKIGHMINRYDFPQLAVKFGIDALYDNSFQGYVFYNLRKLKLITE